MESDLIMQTWYSSPKVWTFGQKWHVSPLYSAQIYILGQWFTTSAPECHSQYWGVPKCWYVFQYIIKNTFSKCHQTLKQFAMGSPPGAANCISLL